MYFSYGQTGNSTINAFMELNKLKLASHIWKQNIPCPGYQIHEDKLKDSQAEKYLGDVISEKGTLDETIQQRKLKRILLYCRNKGSLV